MAMFLGEQRSANSLLGPSPPPALEEWKLVNGFLCTRYIILPPAHQRQSTEGRTPGIDLIQWPAVILPSSILGRGVAPFMSAL